MAIVIYYKNMRILFRGRSKNNEHINTLFFLDYLSCHCSLVFSVRLSYHINVLRTFFAYNIAKRSLSWTLQIFYCTRKPLTGRDPRDCFVLNVAFETNSSFLSQTFWIEIIVGIIVATINTQDATNVTLKLLFCGPYHSFVSFSHSYRRRLILFPQGFVEIYFHTVCMS